MTTNTGEAAFEAAVFDKIKFEPLSSIGDLVSLPYNVSDPRRALSDHLLAQNWLLPAALNDRQLKLPPTIVDDIESDIFEIADFTRQPGEEEDLRTTDRKFLKPEELSEIGRTGQLTLQSRLFENQTHVWQLSRAFYSGNQTRFESFMEGIGRSLDHLVVFAVDRLWGHPVPATRMGRKEHGYGWSLRSSIFDTITTVARLVSRATFHIVGSPIKQPKYYHEKIENMVKEFSWAYVLYMLHGEEGETSRVIAFDSESHRKHHRKQLWDALCKDTDVVPFMDDLRSGIEATREKEAVVDKVLLQAKAKFDEDMNLRLRDKVATETTGKRPWEVKRENRDSIVRMREKISEAWETFLLQDGQGDEISGFTESEKAMISTVGSREAARLGAKRIKTELRRTDEDAARREVADYGRRLPEEFSLLSWSKEWKRRHLARFSENLNGEMERTREESRLSKKLIDEANNFPGLAGEVRVSALRKSSETKDLEAKLRKQLQSLEIPASPARFYILRFTSPRSDVRHWEFDVDRGKWFWRIPYTFGMLASTFSNMVGGAFYFGAHGPLSLRALFSVSPFYAYNRSIPDSEELEKDIASLTQTLVSRLGYFYESIRRSRDEFEKKPDMGLLGKSAERFFLRIYHTVLRAVGTVWISAFMVVGTLVSTALCVAVLVTSPALSLLATIVMTLFSLAVVDFSVGRDPYRDESWVFSGNIGPVLRLLAGVPYVLVCGGMRGLYSGCLAVIVHPAMALIHSVWATVRYGLRTVRDAAAWPFVRRARRPVKDSFLAKRIHGPGLASAKYYRLSLDSAKTAFVALLDAFRLDAHTRMRRFEVLEPFKMYEEFFENLLKSFGMTARMEGMSPSAISQSLTWKATKENPWLRSAMLSHRAETHTNIGFLDEIASSIRAAHPETRKMSAAQEWTTTNIAAASEPLSLLDLQIHHAVDNVSVQDSASAMPGSAALDEMARRTGRFLAVLQLRTMVRSARLCRAILLPPNLHGKFRLAEAELDELWNYAISSTRLYGENVRDELLEIAAQSDVRSMSEQATDISDRLWVEAGSADPRAGASDYNVELVAAHLLSRLFGDDTMLIPLEEMDKSLVVTPPSPEEEEHLVFFRKDNARGGLHD